MELRTMGPSIPMTQMNGKGGSGGDTLGGPLGVRKCCPMSFRDSPCVWAASPNAFVPHASSGVSAPPAFLGSDLSECDSVCVCVCVCVCA